MTINYLLIEFCKNGVSHALNKRRFEIKWWKFLNPCAQNDMESTSSGSAASKMPSASKKLFVSCDHLRWSCMVLRTKSGLRPAQHLRCSRSYGCVLACPIAENNSNNKKIIVVLVVIVCCLIMMHFFKKKVENIVCFDIFS